MSTPRTPPRSVRSAASALASTSKTSPRTALEASSTPSSRTCFPPPRSAASTPVRTNSVALVFSVNHPPFAPSPGLSPPPPRVSPPLASLFAPLVRAPRTPTCPNVLVLVSVFSRVRTNARYLFRPQRRGSASLAPDDASLALDRPTVVDCRPRRAAQRSAHHRLYTNTPVKVCRIPRKTV
jgi:hypothetical protein